MPLQNLCFIGAFGFLVRMQRATIYVSWPCNAAGIRIESLTSLSKTTGFIPSLSRWDSIISWYAQGACLNSSIHMVILHSYAVCKDCCQFCVRSPPRRIRSHTHHPGDIERRYADQTGMKRITLVDSALVRDR